MSDETTVAVLCVVPCAVGLIYAFYEYYAVSTIKIVGPQNLDGLDAKLKEEDSTPISAQLDKMIMISSKIAEGANAYLVKQFQYLSVFILLVAIALGAITATSGHGVGAALCFIVGALVSLLCGFIGMRIAVYANVRTAHEAWKDLNPAFQVALRAGAVMGFALVSLGVLALYLTILAVRASMTIDVADATARTEGYAKLFEAVSGFGLGGSFVALFARVGGGIYTKAADVGADLSGKNEFGIDEDDPRNPACIADNVGDNVGDIAGMGADLFGSLAESTCAALVVASASTGLTESWSALMFPLVVSSVGILVGILTMFIFRLTYNVNRIDQVEFGLKIVLILSTVLMNAAVIGTAYLLPKTFMLTETLEATRVGIIVVVSVGLWVGLMIGLVTEYFTSHSYGPVRKVADTQKTSAATGIISGLALGYNSCVVPVLLLGITIGVAHYLAGFYGISLAAIGMLGTLALSLTIDAYGPISDNAGGIAEMSNLGAHVRERTDALDAAGNTTAAIGKGFAIGSAALVSLALFGAFCVRVKLDKVDLLNPWIFIGVVVGAMLPYWFSAMTMQSVGDAATEMVAECLKQFPKIISGEAEPDYAKCIKISTTSALKEMIAPGILVVASPILARLLIGLNGCAGLLVGILVSGIQMAISASNTGGAWDNAKKYIEAGGIPGHTKGSATHKNAVTGDTVGDPLKDTSGPALNILVKLSAIIALVVVGEMGIPAPGESRDPFWAQ